MPSSERRPLPEERGAGGPAVRPPACGASRSFDEGERGIRDEHHPTGSSVGSSRPCRAPQESGLPGAAVFGAIIGVPVAAIAYFFLKWVTELQQYVFTTLPGDLGFTGSRLGGRSRLAMSGLLVALTIRYLPGTAGHEPADGFKSSGPPADRSPRHRHRGLRHPQPRGRTGARSAVDRDRQRDRGPGGASDQARRTSEASVVIGAAGSFAAISTLLGSPSWGLPDDGGVRARWPDARESCWCRACSPPASGAHLRRAGRLDRFRYVLALGPRHPALRDADRRRVPLGGRDRPRRRRPGNHIRRLALLLQPIVARRRVLMTPVPAW